MSIITFIGWFGAFLIVLFYVLNLASIIQQKTFTYQIANLFGSVLLVINAYYSDSLPFVLINGVWALSSVFSIVYYFLKRNEK